MFNEIVTVQQSDLVLKGRDSQGSETTYSFTDFSSTSGPGPTTAVWTISGVFEARQVSAKLLSSASNVRDQGGNSLDGEWDNPSNLADGSSDTFPSGNGTAGGNFSFSFTSLPGDTTLGGAGSTNIVNGGDYTVWADNFLQPGSFDFTEADWTGNAAVDGADYTLWSDNFLKDFTGSPFVQAALPGMNFGYGREGARNYVEWLYTTAARDWRLDARRFLGAIDRQFSEATDAALEDEFFKFDWVNRIVGVKADSANDSLTLSAAESSEDTIDAKLEYIARTVAADRVSPVVREQITRGVVFWRQYVEDNGHERLVTTPARLWFDRWHSSALAKLS